ncbi:TetR/AcrR family transcriptional regulator [Methylobacillus gramineus]|uniref:TetR/AcrR family transcriptional regulator n=1 Tax=Methylobacillus gramineus TaxID=755169 RepID=UPI001CFFF75B|nr:TetR/AcrR family transcriptional regulator [Methylobacillus gramineus]MCB5185321.1 TetR/AcrR family transcriptional regulator [Methylobacillus gramineus]
MKEKLPPPARGPVDHDVRDQIVEAAAEHFSRYGYEKTTVSDLAKAIGFSKAYIYKFFDSKQAIGEVICSNTLRKILTTITESMEGSPTSAERFRRMFKSAIGASVQLFFQDRKLYDIAAAAAGENWNSVAHYDAQLKQTIFELLQEGRASGEFERKTPIDETVNAIYFVMKPYLNPLLLQHNLDRAEDAGVMILNLILRSLAP